MFSDVTQTLIGLARALHGTDPLAVDPEQSIYALDGTTINPCLTLFFGARSRQSKAPAKVHTLLDLRGNLVVPLLISDGALHKVNGLRNIAPQAGGLLCHPPRLPPHRRALSPHCSVDILRCAEQTERGVNSPWLKSVLGRKADSSHFQGDTKWSAGR
jgi:hypothetical protein